MVLVRMLLALVALIGATGSAFAQAPTVALRDVSMLPVCIAAAARGDTPAAMFADAARYDCGSEQWRHGPGDFWALSAPLPASTSPQATRVRLTSVWQSGLTLYARYADGKIAVMRDTSATLSRRVQLGAIVEYAAPVRVAPIERLLWRVDGSANARGVVLGAHLVDAQASGRSNTVMAAIYAGFVGLAVALLIYNLALWGALRHQFQLAYCLMVAMLIGYALSSSGALAWTFPALDNNDRIRLNYVFLGLTAASAILFARTFFEPQVFAGWMGKVSTAATVALAASGLIFAAFSARYMARVDMMCSMLFVGGLAIVPPILWRAWRVGSRFLWLFAVAWAAPIVFAGARILAATHVIGTGFWLDNSTVLSMASEALLSSLAIAYRVQMLSRERDDALAGELRARKLADADPLTGLLNRRAFLEAAVRRTGAQTLHLIDIDHFKAVNETLGHDGGDEVLRVFARTLRAAVPAGGLIARFGGEEFAVVMHESSAIDAAALLATLRTARMPFDLTVTSSIGTCTGPIASEIDWKALYRNADRALFEAKAGGRDRSRRAPALPLAA